MPNVPAIIDDAEVALDHLSEMGKRVVRDACWSIRAAILDLATRRGWCVIDHRKFAEWATSLMRSSGNWLVLDPLLQASILSARVLFLRVSRVLRDGKWELDVSREQLSAIRASNGDVFGLVDDAAATGSTIDVVHRALEHSGKSVSELLLCTTTGMARRSLENQMHGVEWHLFKPGLFATIHLRDACPYLPFSGRPSATHPSVEAANGVVDIRIPSIAREAGLWPHVFADYRVLTAVVHARSEVSVRLSRELAREATVMDLPLLGRHVPLPAYPRHEITAATSLASLC